MNPSSRPIHREGWENATTGIRLAAWGAVLLCVGCDATADVHDASSVVDADTSVDTDAGMTDAGMATRTDGGPIPGTDAGMGSASDAGSAAPLVGWMVDETTVGLAPLGLECDALPVYEGPSDIPAGSVISGVRFTSNIVVHQGNITIERSCFQPTRVGRGVPLITTTNLNAEPYPPARAKVVIRDSELDGSLLSTELAAFCTGFWGIADLQRNYIHHLGGGLALYNTGSELDALVEHNYVTDMIAFGDAATTGNHIDAFTIRDFTATVRPDRVAIIRNNRFDASAPMNVTGAFFIQPLWERIDNVTIEGNLLEGDGWNLVLEHRMGYSEIHAINNRLAPTGWGATYHDGPGWSTWRDNYRYDPRAPDARGASVGP